MYILYSNFVMYLYIPLCAYINIKLHGYRKENIYVNKNSLSKKKNFF